MRAVLLSVAALGAGLVMSLPGTAAASHDASGGPAEDFAVGDPTIIEFFRSVGFDAHSGPNGENPRGTAHASTRSTYQVSGRVTCLTVTGNRATIGFAVEEGITTVSPHGGHLIFVEDNGSPGTGRDRANDGPVAEPPTVCPPATDADFIQIPGFPPFTIRSGETTVHDFVAPRVLFGKSTVGSAFSPLDHNDKYGSRYYLLTASPVTVTKLRAYLDGLGRTSGSQLVRGLIYRHTSTGPGALVARTFQVGLAAGRPPGWVDLYFPFPPRLTAGGYWLTLHAGESENVVRYAFDVKAGAQRHNDDLFSNGPLNPFGGSDTAAKEMSIHAIGR